MSPLSSALTTLRVRPRQRDREINVIKIVGRTSSLLFIHLTRQSLPTLVNPTWSFACATFKVLSGCGRTTTHQQVRPRRAWQTLRRPFVLVCVLARRRTQVTAFSLLLTCHLRGTCEERRGPSSSVTPSACVQARRRILGNSTFVELRCMRAGTPHSGLKPDFFFKIK